MRITVNMKITQTVLNYPYSLDFYDSLKNEVNHDPDKIGDRSPPSYCELYLVFLRVIGDFFSKTVACSAAVSKGNSTEVQRK